MRTSIGYYTKSIFDELYGVETYVETKIPTRQNY